MEDRTCSIDGCGKPGEVAIRTTHGGSDTAGLKTTVWSALEDAPKPAQAYCAAHGAKLLSDLVLTLTGNYGRGS